MFKYDKIVMIMYCVEVSMEQQLLNNKELIDLHASTAFGALSKYITSADVNNFNPMNVNFGIFDALGYDTKKKDRKEEYVNRALKIINETKEKYLND
jgi:methylenetetrahydrofolate--tRNA-(uracil-5-)-methyltransferase